VRVAAALVFLLVIAALTTAQISAQANSERSSSRVFEVRAATAASFLASYTSYVLTRERQLAAERLGARVVPHSEFTEYLDAFGFGPAVLLDNSGHLLDVAPYDSRLIGIDVSAEYAYLTRAVAGHAVVSNVVPSVEHIPIVGFATPFDTPYGRRVISGAFDIASRPMGLYLRHALPYRDGGVYLVDDSGKVIASNKSSGDIFAAPPAAVSTRPGTGRVTDTSGTRLVYSTAAVAGTPWRLVITVPAATLFQPISAAARVLAWVLLIAFASAFAALVALFVRYREGRAAARVDARTDALTGLPNRRAMDEALARHIADHHRYGSDLAVLIVDIDHFKTVNDTHGHRGGDAVLRAVAARAANSIRANDILGRWGGEEFVVVATHTPRDGLTVLAERLRHAVGRTPIVIGAQTITATVSVGGTVAQPADGVEDLVARADAALYVAKNTGRDRSVITEDLHADARDSNETRTRS
jgi:diguanylate cyclase (GGDEF)-like protein